MMTANEELGERRLQVFLTVVSAAGVGLGLAVERSDGSVALWVAAC